MHEFLFSLRAAMISRSALFLTSIQKYFAKNSKYQNNIGKVKFMHIFVLIAISLVTFFSTAELTAAKVIKIGDFPIAGTIHKKGFILDDGKIYKPVSKHQKTNTIDWLIGDPILALQRKHKNRYVLVNMRVGQKATMRRGGWGRV